ncbi:hypothetical protein [Butyrivibrio sp. INlla21]|uniref:hypothetical protein n=1 Tax=Butyrivibrio sp. INlla21 TaxID=1520811 RepID=UPI0008F2F678|nr:hypothetical protein [Butyrivibrio sp. INlla21]SFU32976.1 hypothetical protein SAMN02910342_00101 [Butyrivibrio sp. INlla21]
MKADTNYFEYLCSMARLSSQRYRKYRGLLRHLYQVEFRYIHPMDENRVFDAIDLRREYFDRGDVGDTASVLEVLLAFSRRIETEIMSDDPDRDRIERWFWVMLENLGLLEDGIYDSEEEINRILDIWMDRKFTKKGHGNIFSTSKSDTDLRDVEFWWQMQRYMVEKYGN